MSGASSSPQPEMKSAVFEWDVARDVFNRDKRVHTANFKFGLDEEIFWFLSLDPRFACDEGIYVNIWLVPDTEPLSPIHANCKFGLMTGNGKERNVFCGHGVFSKDICWGKDQFIKLDSLLDEENGYFKDDKVTIFCELEVHKRLEIAQPTFNSDFNRMRESEELVDVTLVVGGEVLKAHKFVLSARSVVFAAMFRHDTKENRSGRVEIEDLEVAGVKGLLDFFYTGEVKGLYEMAEKVLPAADKYGVERLKTLCEQALCDSLLIENVAEFLELAELHSAKQLKARALAYIAQKSAEVVKDPSFWELEESNRKLFREAVCAQAERAESEKHLVNRVKLSDYRKK